MADEVKQLLVQVSATTELLRSNLIAAERQIDSFTRTAEASGARVQRNFQQVGQSAAAQRAGFQQLGFQVQDFAVQVAGGTSAVRAFSQQFPQAVGAASLLFNQTSKIGAFLGGPWGAALGTAAVVLTPFIAKLFDTADAANAANKALQRLREQRLAAEQERRTLTDAQGDLSKLRSREAGLLRSIVQKSRGRTNPDGTPMFAYREFQELVGVKREIAARGKDIEFGIGQIAPLDRFLETNEPASRASRSGGAGRSPAAAKLSAWDKFLADGGQDMRSDMYDALFKGYKDFAEEREKLNNEDFEQSLKLIDQKNDYEFDKRQDALQRLREAEANQIQFLGNLFESAFRGGTKAIWRDFKELGLSVISQLLARMAVARISGKGFDFSSALSSTFSSILGFADGGRPPVGRMSVVGERGPELFIPDVAGTIVPNGAWGGAGALSITINAPGATAETVSMIRREMAVWGPQIVQAASITTTRQLGRPRI